MNIRHLLSRVWELLSLDEGRITVAKVQDAIETAILATGVRTKYGSSIEFGNTMVVRISPEALDVVAPVLRRVVAEIEQHLPDRVHGLGYNIDDATLHVSVIKDATLEGLNMTVKTMDEDLTPNAPRTRGNAPRNGAGNPPNSDATTQVQPIRLVHVGSGGSEWVLREGHRTTIGRRTSNPASITDLEIEHPLVSRLHVVVEPIWLPRGRSGVAVADQDSRHGTYLNGTRLKPHAVAHAAHGDLLQLTGPKGPALRVVVGTSDHDPTMPTMPTY